MDSSNPNEGYGNDDAYDEGIETEECDSPENVSKTKGIPRSADSSFEVLGQRRRIQELGLGSGNITQESRIIGTYIDVTIVLELWHVLNQMVQHF